MIESASIQKKQIGADEFSFEKLKKEGIERVQNLSGKRWTDYNVHDPGVTILEQLCYALTELVYRTEFKLEDFLTDENGHIDFESQALYPPERIFPCRPTVLDDYRKIIVDAVAEVDNVWISQVREGDYSGLYDIAIKLKQDAVNKNPADVITRVRQLYLQQRNLCEDINEINVMREVDCDLYADIEVRGRRPPIEVLAEIYYKCSNHIAAGIRFRAFEDMCNEGKSLEEIFTGPFTRHGIIEPHELDDKPDEMIVADVFSVIKAIEGVEDIKNLYFKIDREVHDQTLSSGSPDAVLRLRIPQGENEINVKLNKNGRKLPVSTLEFNNRYSELNYKHHLLERTPQELSSLYTLPRGQYRNLRQYTSIQNHFPSIYGINAYGVPESASPVVKARAAQLKAYLAIFEQLMANYTANMNSIRTLFSPQNHPKQSYFSQTLKDDIIPGIEPIYKKSPSEILSKILNKHDKYADRKSRLLDYLLGLYGETFTQHSLRYFNDYYTPAQVEEMIINNKIALLENIVEIGRDRAGACNYGEKCWNSTNISGMQRRVSLLLGFKRLHSRSLPIAILKHGFKLVSHKRFTELREGTPELKFLSLDEADERTRYKFQNIPLQIGGKVSLKEIRRDIDQVVPLKNNLISEVLLRFGIFIERYRLVSLTENKNYQIVFNTNVENEWWYLATYPDKKAGIEAINALRRFLIHLNIESEGLHVVEHILLRPEGKPRHEDLPLSQQEDFYSFRVSMIFPAWTARCHDENFRLLAEDTVQRNCPAHVYPQFYWFEFNKMVEFETLYKNWLKLKRDEGVRDDELNAAASRLIEFLIQHRTD
jgi:hypothetical protein